jgi:hypothetical protein
VLKLFYLPILATQTAFQGSDLLAFGINPFQQRRPLGFCLHPGPVAGLLNFSTKHCPGKTSTDNDSHRESKQKNN